MFFSERYGYLKPSDVLKRGSLDKEGATALCNCYDYLFKWLNEYDIHECRESEETYTYMEKMVWCFFLHQRLNEFYTGRVRHRIVITDYLLSDELKWFRKFDLIEFSLKVLRSNEPCDSELNEILKAFIGLVNDTFQNLNYAYRVVDNQIVEITDQEEINEINEAVEQSSSVKTHLSNALKHMANRPDPDYRNSIKESISAIEALCRDITGKTTLGDSLKELENNGVIIPTFLKQGIEKLYIYTNDYRTGIRHALMNESEAPSFAEAKYMVVACSAFVNYIQSKRS